jgi:L-ascorbate metabolism protein UlaG (beta-lactamase superfamily)
MVTFLGHATFLIESGGEALLTDPVFSNRVGRFFTKRTSPSRIEPGSLSRVAGVLVSHGHHDHLDYPSLYRIRRTVSVIAPWGLAPSLRWHGFTQVQVIKPWTSTVVANWRIMAVPSRHFGGRLPLVGTSGHVGFVLTGPSCIYFAGDTGYDEGTFQEIGRRFDLDLALLPIAGAVFPWYRRNHMNSEEAVRAFQCLGARLMIPMHFGTFPASFEPPGEPLRRFREETERLGLAPQIRILADGQQLEFVGSGKGEIGSTGIACDPDASLAA